MRHFKATPLRNGGGLAERFRQEVTIVSEQELENSRHSGGVCLILTATIDVAGIAFMKRNEAATRLDDYLWALGRWLAKSRIGRIVFAENSGADLTPLRELASSSAGWGQRVEFISFNGQDFPRYLGKGYGELMTLMRVMENSKFLSEASAFIKINGRYFVSNCDPFFQAAAGQIDVLCDFSRSLTWADARLFGGSLRFLREYLCPMIETINDTQGNYLEHALCRSALRCIAEGGRWRPWPCAPVIAGIAGTIDKPYTNRLFERIGKSAYYRLKNRIFMR